MVDITELWAWMLLIALVAFAPLGFFIYRFSTKSHDQLGTPGAAHEQESKVEALVNKILGHLLTKQS